MEQNLEHLQKFVYPVYQKIKESGYEIYLVGGCMRDILMKRPITDWDLTTKATPEEIQKLFPESFYENEFGTVGIPIENGMIEITTYRKDLEYKDFRHPTSVEWGKNLTEDLERRDFTINAIAAEIIKIEPTIEFNIIDPFNGQEDILKKEIKAVGDPEKRFTEDALRLMRAIRFATQLNFSIEANTWNALLKNAYLLEHISKERIRDELFKILSSDRYYEGIQLLDEAGMLGIIFPQLMKGKGISQERPGRHHKTDVFTHNMLSLKETPSIDPLVRLATLLHDVGKPYVQSFDEEGLVIFYNHEVAGAKIASEIADSLRLSKKQKEKMYTLIRWHMFPVSENLSDSAIRRFIRRVGVENVKDMIDLRIGDRLGGGTQTAESWRLKKFKERLEEQLNPPFSLNDMVVDGSDVMKELNIKPGPKVGRILNKLFEEVDEDLEKNDREYLLKRIQKIKDE
jgi:putative nucleotidyltransferase with HDIG domain